MGYGLDVGRLARGVEGKGDLCGCGWPQSLFCLESWMVVEDLTVHVLMVEEAAILFWDNLY